MSQGIMERNLPVADSIGEGDKVRIVTAQGNSKNVDASQIGGGGNLILTETVEETQTGVLHTLSSTYNEIVEVLTNGNNIRAIVEYSRGGENGFSVHDCIVDNNTPYEITDATEAGMPVGYYFMSPWNNDKSFYSETADGDMTYTNLK